jgi:hypothetical protein
MQSNRIARGEIAQIACVRTRMPSALLVKLEYVRRDALRGLADSF